VPPLPPIAEPTFELVVTAAEVEEGKRLFTDYCFACHGANAVSGGITPDLRRTSAQVHGQINDIVLGGAREGLGMPRFDDSLDEDDVRMIQGYILHRASESAGGF